MFASFVTDVKLDFASATFRAMALAHVGPASLPADERPSGPNQKCRGVHGQYVYWTTWSYPSEWAVQNLGLASPDSMSRVQFGEAIIEVYKACGVEPVETRVFLEPHASGKPHLNCFWQGGPKMRSVLGFGTGGRTSACAKPENGAHLRLALVDVLRVRVWYKRTRVRLCQRRQRSTFPGRLGNARAEREELPLRSAVWRLAR